jgi:DNA-binding CsgD family transcriptional regulator
VGKKGNNPRSKAHDAEIEEFVSRFDFVSLDGVPILSEPVWRERVREIAEWLPDETRNEIADRLDRSLQYRTTVDFTMFAARHKLTATELLLVESLVRGATVAEHAAERGISVNTARVHMQRVLDKTGARRQADLIRMLLV